MDQPDLRRLLENPEGGDTSAALGRVRARHLRRRAARLRTAALSSVVVVGLGLGLGLGLSPASSPRRHVVAVAAGTRPQMTFRQGPLRALLPTGYANSSSSTAQPLALGLKSGLCSVLGCGGRIGRRELLGKSQVGPFEVAAYLSSVPPLVKGGTFRPLTGPMALPRVCGQERYITAVLSRKTQVVALVLVPLAPGRGGGAFAEVSESLARPKGSRHGVVIATAEVSAEVHSVRGRLPGGRSWQGSPHHGIVVLAGLVPSGLSNPTVGLRALSRSGRTLESVVVPGPSRIGLPRASCLQPTG